MIKEKVKYKKHPSIELIFNICIFSYSHSVTREQTEFSILARLDQARFMMLFYTDIIQYFAPEAGDLTS